MSSYRAHGTTVRSYVVAAGRWWWVILSLAVVLGAIGGVSSALSPYKSEVLLRVNTDSPDSTRVTQLAQTSVRLVDSSVTYARAAERLGLSPDDLRNKAVVGWLSDTELISIVVEGSTAIESERFAGGMADAAVTEVRDLASTRLQDTQAGTDRVLATGALRDRDAEQARRQAIGTAAADRQDGALASSVLLTRTGDVRPAVHSGVSPAVGVLAGVLCGIACGLLFASTRGRRSGRVRRAGDIEAVLPDARFLTMEQAAVVTTSALAGTARRVAVLHATGLEQEAESFARDIADDLRSEGRSVTVTSLDAPRAAEAARAGGDAGRARESAPSDPDAPTHVVVGELDDRDLARVRGRVDALALVISLSGRQPVRPLASIDSSDPLFVVDGSSVASSTARTRHSPAVTGTPPRRPTPRASEVEGGAVTEQLAEAELRRRTSPSVVGGSGAGAHSRQPHGPAE